MVGEVPTHRDSVNHGTAESIGIRISNRQPASYPRADQVGPVRQDQDARGSPRERAPAARQAEDDPPPEQDAQDQQRAVARSGAEPPIGLGVMLVSDEETGSDYGLKYIAREHSDLFGNQDLIVIPDYGVEDSSLIEIAEKSMLWLRVQIEGRQCHASKPNQGVNSLRAAADMIMRLEGLSASFANSDPLFDPPVSTFEPTKKEANVPNVNTIPGMDVFYLDCRVLPEYNLDEVVNAAEAVGREIEADHGVKVEITVPKREQAAPATPVDSEVVTGLSRAIRDVYGVEPRPGGIGGGTVAAVLRDMGLPSAVWATSMHYAHQPNEQASVSGQIGDAKVLAKLLFGA